MSKCNSNGTLNSSTSTVIFDTQTGLASFNNLLITQKGMYMILIDVKTTNTNNCCSSSPPEMSSEFEFAKHFNALSQKLVGISNFLDQMNYRLKQLEEHSTHQSQKTQTHLRTPILGPQHLEGLVMVPEIKVSKKDESDLDTKNIVIQPNFTIPISDISSVNTDNQEFTDKTSEEMEAEEIEAEEMEAKEEQEVVEEEQEVAEEEQEVAEEEQEEVADEEQVEEQEEVEEDTPLELEEFTYKNKKYFKDQYNKVYRQIDEETPEDEPFAEYNEETKKLTRLPN